MIRVIIALFSALFIFALPFAATAQNDANPGGFFSDDYARGLLEEPKNRREGPVYSNPGDQRERPQRPARTEATPAEDNAPIDTDRTEEQHPAGTNVMDMSSGVPIESLNAIINIQDAEHFIKHLTELKDVVVQYNVQPGTLILVGYAQIDPFLELFLPILVRGGNVTSDITITETYQTTLSPTWIIRTEKGDVVLEGVPALSRFLTSKGELQAHHLE